MSYKEAYLYLLLTRLPLNLLFTQKFPLYGNTLCKQQIPLDLHVLGTSPAFTLSHDQTLSTNISNKFESDWFLKNQSEKNFFEILSGTNSFWL